MAHCDAVECFSVRSINSSCHTTSGLALLKATVGHRLLFLHDDPKQPVELSQSEIVLEIQKKKNQFTLKIIPYSNQTEQYAIILENVF